MNDIRIGFVGLGKLGLPCAEVMAEHFDVFGYDLLPRASESVCIMDDIESLMKSIDIVFVSVPTPHTLGYDGRNPSSDLEPKDFEYLHVKECLLEVNEYVHREQLVVLISTVLPGTVRKDLAPLLSNASLIYNPYLIAMGTVKWDMVHPEMIIIGNESGNEDNSIVKLRHLYGVLASKRPRIAFGTWEEAESIKIFYNTFISAKLGLVNMIQDVAERLGNMNVDIVTTALMDSTHRIMGPAYMKAGMGDGGPCHPRDNIALRYLAENLELEYDLFGAIMESREVQAKHMAAKCITFGHRVVVLGTSYKPDVDLRDGSYALLVGHYIEDMGEQVYYDEAPEIEDAMTYLLSHEGKFNDFPFNFGSTIVDPWRSFQSDRDDLNIYWYGNTRH